MTDDATAIARDYLATPDPGRGPGVLVLHSGRGLTPSVRRLCHRLTRAGFVALAPDLFDGATPETVAAADEAKAALDAPATLDRLEDAAAFLRRHEAVSRRRVGVVGLGYGATWACRLAARLGDRCGAVVLFYGLEDANWAAVSAPVLGHFAGLDHDLPQSRVNDLREAFRRHAVDHDLFVYPGVEPSFFETDATARHDPDAAQLAWDRTRRFLRAALLESDA